MSLLKITFAVTIWFALLIPAILLTGLIWIFGGWVRGFDYMPNPVYRLFELLDWGAE